VLGRDVSSSPSLSLSLSGEFLAFLLLVVDTSNSRTSKYSSVWRATIYLFEKYSLPDLVVTSTDYENTRLHQYFTSLTDQTWHPNIHSSAKPRLTSNSLAYPRAISTGCPSARRYAGKPCHFTFNTNLVGIELTDLAHNDLLQPIALFFVSFLIQTSLCSETPTRS
jgi:hypothetical protein